MRSFFERSTVLILSNTQYVRGVDIAYTKQKIVREVGTGYIMQYTVFPRVSALFILWNTQYFGGFDTAHTEKCAVFWDGRHCLF